MIGLIFVLLCLGAAIALALWRAPIWAWAVLVAVATLLIQTGVAFGPMGGFTFTKILGWLPAIALAALAYRPFRQQIVTRPAFRMVKKIMPPVSPTEREALEAGTLGFDAELFGGEPDWNRLRAVRPISLTEDERNFLEGPTEELCKMLDDWQIRAKDREIPENVWNFIKQKGFLGMLISKEHGGLGFSAQAQSLILGKVAVALARRLGRRHGAELARPGRADREIRHRRAEEEISRPARTRRGSAVLCADRPLCRIGRGLDARHRHRDARHA